MNVNRRIEGTSEFDANNTRNVAKPLDDLRGAFVFTYRGKEGVFILNKISEIMR